jgi:hypothetical protein
MKCISLSVILILICIYAQSQNLVGFAPKEIRQYMKENRKEMINNKVINSKFSYLKYSDTSESETLLFFLTRDSVCKNERIICDITLKPEKIKEFNSYYTRKGDNTWIDKRNGKEYNIEMEDGKWSCVISIETNK